MSVQSKTNSFSLQYQVLNSTNLTLNIVLDRLLKEDLRYFGQFMGVAKPTQAMRSIMFYGLTFSLVKECEDSSIQKMMVDRLS